MIFGILVLIGFGTIVLVVTVLVMSGIVRSRKGSESNGRANYYRESYSSTPEHLKPHYVQKPRDFDRMVKEEPQNETPFLYTRPSRPTPEAARPAPRPVSPTPRPAPRPAANNFNSYVEQKPYTNNTYSTASAAPRPVSQAPRQVATPVSQPAPQAPRPVSPAPRQAPEPQSAAPRDFNSYIEQKPYANNSFLANTTYAEPRPVDEELMNYARSLREAEVNSPPNNTARVITPPVSPQLSEPVSQGYEALNKNYRETNKSLMQQRIEQYSRPLREQDRVARQLTDDFGYSVHNTIPIKSQSDVLKYLDLLKTQSGEKIHYVKTGVLEGPDQFRPIEEYKISLHGEEIANLYFNINTPFPARRIPQGFTF